MKRRLPRREDGGTAEEAEGAGSSGDPPRARALLWIDAPRTRGGARAARHPAAPPAPGEINEFCTVAEEAVRMEREKDANAG
eukprot:gene14180-15410_t